MWRALNLQSSRALGGDEEDRAVRLLRVGPVLERCEGDPNADGLAAPVVPLELEVGCVSACEHATNGIAQALHRQPDVEVEEMLAFHLVVWSPPARPSVRSLPRWQSEAD